VWLLELWLNYTFGPLKKQLFLDPLSLLSVAILAPHANFDPVNGHVGATCVIFYLYFLNYFLILKNKKIFL